MITITSDDTASGEVSQDELEDAAYREDDDYLLLDEDEDFEDQDLDDLEDSDAYPYNDPTQGPLPFSSDDPEEEKLWLEICDIAASGKEDVLEVTTGVPMPSFTRKREAAVDRSAEIRRVHHGSGTPRGAERPPRPLSVPARSSLRCR